MAEIVRRERKGRGGRGERMRLSKLAEACTTTGAKTSRGSDIVPW